jgi:CheY-like chemotaxis protein
VNGTRPPDHLADHREARAVDTPILVVEDDPQLRAIFQLLLEGEGYPIVTATDGLEALRAARTMRPSQVIVDLACRCSTATRSVLSSAQRMGMRSRSWS